MKKSISLNLFLAFTIVIFAFTFKAERIINAKIIEQSFVRINDRLFLDKYEVSNANYNKFMTYLKEANKVDLYKKCLWDSTKWSSNEPMEAYYHSHNSYDKYPVVSISYDAATEYCKWLTYEYNLDANRKFKKVIFRLPSEQEWTEAATAGNKDNIYPWDNNYLRNKQGQFLCNYLHLGDESITYDLKTGSYKIQKSIFDKQALPTPTNSFYPSRLGLYNLSGNAAEMVLEKGLAKGGSYNDPGQDVTILSKKYYESASTEIGFRVAMEIIEK